MGRWGKGKGKRKVRVNWGRERKGRVTRPSN